MLKFTSRNNTKYIYNQIDNNIFPINEKVSWADITTEFQKAYPPTNISFIGPDSTLLNNKYSEALIINLTDSCNLRCTYCAYSDHYPFERSHNKAQISLAVAKTAVDEYLSRSCHLKQRRINLYGGEPTMASNLVYKIVNYINSKVDNVDFSINTNAYSFTKEWINFIVKHNIQLQISIDGDKTRHDKYRININGKGTFDKIKENLTKLYNYSSVYYERNIVFLATLSPPYQLLNIYKLFNSNILFKQPWAINYVRPIDTTFIDSLDKKDKISKYSEQEVILADDFIEAAIKGEAATHFGHWVFSSELKKLHFRDMSPSKNEWINGCCTPGIDKFFVNSKGEYYPCERSGSFMNIGNVKSGLKLENVTEIIDKYTLDCNENCGKCPNLRFCDTCYLGSKRDSILELTRKYDFCTKRIQKLKLILYIYVSILEENISGLDYLNINE